MSNTAQPDNFWTGVPQRSLKELIQQTHKGLIMPSKLDDMIKSVCVCVNENESMQVKLLDILRQMASTVA